ncbi:methylmalonyl Co-A mutase-associated GTPase MeaB [Jatrophihabitans sp.]|uniref:methylmalonyl Co-A mutase-associated GTPase MeaB n=1 Tax=Jatrophihabitans sp. TaxID=1932789 RepID=UPI0030C76FC4|nr:putative GTPase [Jatrophihabitans sp.]
MATRRDVDVTDLISRARHADPRAVARLISFVESDSPVLREVAAGLVGAAGHAHVLGLTGSPGVGKSTTTNALVSALRARGDRVGVLAVDPSSPFSGGALLGDRIRMAEHTADDGVFIRSMASRGQLGGLSAAVPQALRVLDAAGCDVILVETVGVGQAEVEIASLADTTILVLAPGLGDAIQAAKAGVVEIADVYAVNKADRGGAEQVTRDLRQVQSMTAGRHEGWTAAILKLSAASGEGVAELLAAIDAHRAWLGDSGELAVRQQRRAATEIEAIAVGEVRQRFAHVHGSDALDEAAARVVAGESDPYTAAEALIAAL